MKHQLWSFALRVELFLVGIYLLTSAELGDQGGWELEKIVRVAAGGSLFLFGIVFSLPNTIRPLIDHEKRERLSRYLVQASLWCFVSLLLVELILRGLVYNPPLRRDVTNWAGDIPGVHTVMLWGKEGYGVTHYEKWGEIRTPFHDNKKDNNIIVLGDSQTECLQVDDDIKFVSAAETVLRQDGYDVDLHNLGRSGLAMADYVSWIPPYRALYKPKVIVVQITENDFAESFGEGQFNYFVRRDNEGIDLVHTYDLSSGFIQKARTRYLFPSQIKELGYQRLYLMQDAAAFSPINKVSAKPAETVASGENLDTQTFDAQTAAWQMEMLIDVGKNIPIVMVLLPSAPYLSQGGIEMTDPSHRRLKEFLSLYPEITVVDPLPEFQNLVSTGHLPRGFFNGEPGVGHLNKYGNEIVGRLLADAIGQILR